MGIAAGHRVALKRSKSKVSNIKCAVGPKIWKVCWDDLAVTDHKSPELKGVPAATALSPQQLAFSLFQLKPQLLQKSCDRQIIICGSIFNVPPVP